MNWAAYAEAAQHLSDVRQKQARRQAQGVERNAGLREAVALLRQRLAAQHTHQANIAQQLRTALPAVGAQAEPRAAVQDPDQAGPPARTAGQEAAPATPQPAVPG